jgi:hypothetical protein
MQKKTAVLGQNQQVDGFFVLSLLELSTKSPSLWVTLLPPYPHFEWYQQSKEIFIIKSQYEMLELSQHLMHNVWE